MVQRQTQQSVLADNILGLNFTYLHHLNNQLDRSIDLGGMFAPIGPAVRAQVSLSFEHEGGIAFVASGGGGGSTPVATGGITFTGTNAPSVNKLAGASVQAGGTIGTMFYAEGVAFMDSDSGQKYYGLSITPLTKYSVTYLSPLEGSVHATVMSSTVRSTNFFDLLYYPLEWFLKEE